MESRDERRKRRSALFEKEPVDWTLEELCEELTERYAPSEIPPCPVCGGELSVQASGGGEPTIWACSPYEEDPDDPGKVRPKKDRGMVDDHYRDSRYKDRRQGGDDLVVELIRRVQKAS